MMLLPNQLNLPVDNAVDEMGGKVSATIAENKRLIRLSSKAIQVHDLCTYVLSHRFIEGDRCGTRPLGWCLTTPKVSLAVLCRVICTNGGS